MIFLPTISPINNPYLLTLPPTKSEPDKFLSTISSKMHFTSTAKITWLPRNWQNLLFGHGCKELLSIFSTESKRTISMEVSPTTKRGSNLHSSMCFKSISLCVSWMLDTAGSALQPNIWNSPWRLSSLTPIPHSTSSLENCRKGTLSSQSNKTWPFPKSSPQPPPSTSSPWSTPKPTPIPITSISRPQWTTSKYYSTKPIISTMISKPIWKSCWAMSHATAK